MSKDIINDLIYVNPVSKDDRTDKQFSDELNAIKKEYHIATPHYEIDFKKALTPIRKYYISLVDNFFVVKLNEIINNTKEDKLDFEYQYLYNSTENEIIQYFHFIKEIIQFKELTEELYKSPIKSKINDESYVINYIKYNCIVLYKELQERYDDILQIEKLDFEEITEKFLEEEYTKENIIIPYNGPKIIFKSKPSEKVFKAMKHDLEHRELNEKVLDFDTLIKRQDAFVNLESKLHEYEIIDNNYNFIPNKEKSNKEKLAAFILRLKEKGYFNERRFNPNKPIKNRDITKFFAHRYGANSDADREFRNFQTTKRAKYNQIIDRTFWLDQIT